MNPVEYKPARRHRLREILVDVAAGVATQLAVAALAAAARLLLGAEGPPCYWRARTSVPALGPASTATSSATTTRKPGTAWLPAHSASGRTAKWSGAWGT
ncbi:DUF6408 family protein [Streptomyces sp. GD-15H]|uniref:DUF6408 family protein n=1 Tax=Streptomyces sp. GD-15H TaxID=3129112 RepID=UPI003249B7E5